MKGKELREALRSGRRVYGTLVVADSPARRCGRPS